MRYELMHRNIGVATLNIDESEGNLNSVVSVVNKIHLPVGTFINGFLKWIALGGKKPEGAEE